jgi:hypothetical protein
VTIPANSLVTRIDGQLVRANDLTWYRINWNNKQGWAASTWLLKVPCPVNSPNIRPQGPEYPVESVPTISPAVFEAVLKSRNSPALQQGFSAQDLYNAALKTGINPAIPLAFFFHESQLGTAGIATLGINNWGNLRPVGTYVGRGIGIQDTEYGKFRRYRNYYDSLLDWIDLMLGPKYRGKSLREALQIYAPSSDGNNPSSYASAVMQLVDAWNKRSGTFELTDDADTAPFVNTHKPSAGASGLVTLLCVAVALLALTVVALGIMLRRLSRNTHTPLVEEMTVI